MLLEKLFLSFCLVKKQIPGPVCGRQSSEGLLQVVVFLEPLDELLQLFLSSLNWSEPAANRQKRTRPEIQKASETPLETDSMHQPGVHLVCLKAQVWIEDQTRRQIIVFTQLFGSHSRGGHVAPLCLWISCVKPCGQIGMLACAPCNGSTQHWVNSLRLHLRFLFLL